MIYIRNYFAFVVVICQYLRTCTGYSLLMALVVVLTMYMYLYIYSLSICVLYFVGASMYCNSVVELYPFLLQWIVWSTLSISCPVLLTQQIQLSFWPIWRVPWLMWDQLKTPLPLAIRCVALLWALASIICSYTVCACSIHVHTCCVFHCSPVLLISTVRTYKEIQSCILLRSYPVS